MSNPKPRASSSSESTRSLPAARVAGSAFAGVIELFGFHPVDTIAKRLMNSPVTIRTPGAPTSMILEGYSKIIFRDAYTESPWRKYTSLFPGLSFAAGYKILQRVYKFGGQPFAREAIDKHCSQYFDRISGGDFKKRQMALHAISGAAIGVGEVVLLPLDVLKIKSQNNPDALRGRGLITILREERLSGLYRGAGWTAARNAPGSFALFGASAFVKAKVFGLEDFANASLSQNFVSSVAGGVASITVASPLDVIKTRIQTRDFNSGESGMHILKDLLRKEGPAALFKGLVPKVLVVGPKLVFSFTIAQHMIGVFERSFNERR